MKCVTCCRNCACPQYLHTGEAKVLVPLSAADIEHLLGQEPGRGNVYTLYRRLEIALDMVKDSF